MRIAAPIEIGPLDAEAQQSVRELAATAEAHDGVAPLSEQPLLNLGTDAEWITHVVAHTPAGSTVGYVQIDRSGPTASAELVVHPEHRRHGRGRVLLRTAERDATLPARSGEPGQHGKELRVWAHGDLEPARAFARAQGLRPVRELLFLARPLDAAPPTAAAAADEPGYRLRTFRPGTDDEAWLRVNARAFASHPEQGRMSLDDLRARQAEPWFDPEGFFLLVPEDGADPAAFLWTKVEEPAPDGTRDGEIYVLGVDPDHQGKGLGRLLTDVGLAHLARSGATRAVLYVEGDNAPALATYRRAGFERAAVHVQYARA
ncbi:mycothiol synthase [Promicromonospora citrea]|uniref:Mycothiol acetyltransferase n=1 Tax=Promicromonospora citrea TaxID=43677 RepID=A0A8H9GEZ3_9MICO|nr:mycothiol synthase [Promicromonospora citrea]NNH53636.1 mycothiol synthase [Promicromonospora citrea]GGM09289.1 mycothiol acetyltransferase [Promicromonospora citrea]